MKNRLQYIYSIAVFFGVLSTAYLMMNQDGNANVPFRTFGGPSHRMEAQIVDPAVNQLLEMESTLSDLGVYVGEELKRVPSETKPIKKKNK